MFSALKLQVFGSKTSENPPSKSLNYGEDGEFILQKLVHLLEKIQNNYQNICMHQKKIVILQRIRFAQATNRERGASPRLSRSCELRYGAAHINATDIIGKASLFGVKSEDLPGVSVFQELANVSCHSRVSAGKNDSIL